MKTMLPVEANTRIAFPIVNLSNVVLKIKIVTIVLIKPTIIDKVHTIARLAVILPSPIYGFTTLGGILT